MASGSSSDGSGNDYNWSGGDPSLDASGAPKGSGFDIWGALASLFSDPNDPSNGSGHYAPPPPAGAVPSAGFNDN